MARYTTLYQRAYYYDIALARDVTREVDFIFKVYEHYLHTPLKSLIDIACGPAYHAIVAAQRGAAVIGLDLMPEMVAFARDKATDAGVEIAFLAEDMRYYKLETPVNMAINMFDGLDGVTYNEDLIQHLRCVAENLTPGGLYLMEHTHPRDCGMYNYDQFSWHGERDGIHVDLLWVTDKPTYDVVNNVAYIKSELHVRENGHKEVIADTAAERLFTPQDIQLLAALSGAFDVIGWYGDFDLNQPLDDTPKSRRAISILQRRD